MSSPRNSHWEPLVTLRRSLVPEPGPWKGLALLDLEQEAVEALLYLCIGFSFGGFVGHCRCCCDGLQLCLVDAFLTAVPSCG